MDRPADRRHGYEFDDKSKNQQYRMDLIHTYTFCFRQRLLHTPQPITRPVSHPNSPQSHTVSKAKYLYLSLARPTLGNLLVDEDADEEDGQGADDAEDENDAGLPGGPILALDELVEGVFAAGEEGSIDCGHFALLRRGWLVGWSLCRRDGGTIGGWHGAVADNE